MIRTSLLCNITPIVQCKIKVKRGTLYFNTVESNLVKYASKFKSYMRLKTKNNSGRVGNESNTVRPKLLELISKQFRIESM